MCYHNQRSLFYMQSFPFSFLNYLYRSVCSFWKAHLLFGVDTPEEPFPPKPPSSAPTQTKRVPICCFLNFVSICTLIKDWNQSVAGLWVNDWDTDAHAYMIHPAPITGLHGPKLLSHLFSIPLSILCWHYPGNLEWWLLLWLASPRGLHPSRAPLWLVDVFTDPPFYLI
jgi:hypothetical protein